MEIQTEKKIEAPSKSSLAKATGIALFVALLLLFTVILPAEYGFDPLGTGKALGLTGISQAAESSSGAAPTSVVQTGVFTPQTMIYKVDSQDFLLRPGQGVEMKYHLQKGASMVYGWKSDGKLTFEFHGEPDQKPNKDYYESYEKNDTVGKDSYYGTFTAPSTGIHGWFWKNTSRKDIHFHLNTAGFFDSGKMFAGGAPEDVPLDDAK